MKWYFGFRWYHPIEEKRLKINSSRSARFKRFRNPNYRTRLNTWRDSNTPCRNVPVLRKLGKRNLTYRF